MKRIIAFLLSILSLFITSSCDSDDIKDKGNSGDTVMSYKEEKMSSGLYGFVFSYNKSSYLYMLQNYDGTAYANDTEAFWNTKTEDGLTLGEGIVKDINNHCKMILVASSVAKEYGVTLSHDDISSAEDELNDLIAVYGSEKKLNDYLRKFGLDAEDVLEYLKDKCLVSVLQAKLCESNGICAVDDEMLFAYAEEHYIKVKHIYYSDDNHDGKAFDDLSAIAEQINSGDAKLDEFKDKSDDSFISSNPDGALAERSTLNEEYLKCADGLKDGMCGVVEIEGGAYLIESLEISEEDIEENFELMYTAVANDEFSKYISSYYDAVEINRAELEKYDIITAETFSFGF